MTAPVDTAPAQPSIDQLLADVGRGRQNLFPALNAVQAAHGWVSAENHARIATALGIPRHEVGAVSSFYPHYRRTPPPAVRVQVCCDLSCHLRGAADVLAAAQRYASADIEVETVSCLGQCDRATAVTINGSITPNVSSATIDALIVQAKQSPGEGHAHVDPPANDGRTYRCHPYGRRREYGALRRLLATKDFDGAIQTIADSGLRGMGGAGFPTGRKWGLVRSVERGPKWVICNADESEPGTIKDRHIMEQAPELVIEGVIIGGLCVGAERGVIYLRHEYAESEAALRAELARCREQGLIGGDLLGSGLTFDLELFVSPGGYICGEETALLEALEGKRAEPRNKPPFPGVHGLHGLPTLINSVETFAFVPYIVYHGAEAWKTFGAGLGLKFLALSGDVNRPGVYEVELGIPARRFIDEYGGGVTGGQALKAFLPGGASSRFLPASRLDTPLDFDSVRQAGSMLGTGAVVVIADGADMLELALNVARFFRNESCGKCVPCGVGSQKLVELLERVHAGSGRADDLALIDELCEAMALGSICGLGQAVPAPILSAIEHFKTEIVARLPLGGASGGAK